MSTTGGVKQITLEIEKDDYHVEEAFKSLRTNLQFCGDDKKVIAFTSCFENEGKSLVTLRLAKTLAGSGKRTLLLDADIRKSVLMGRVKGKNGDILGLSHFLSGQASLSDILYEEESSGIYVIFTGPFPPNPSELLGSKRFKELVEQLRTAFHYVIIDTPPIGSVIDAAVVAEACDGVVLVITQGEVSYRFAQEVKSQLERTGTPILGAVLNKVDPKAEGYGYYGRYYGKYYGKYYGSKG